MVPADSLSLTKKQFQDHKIHFYIYIYICVCVCVCVCVNLKVSIKDSYHLLFFCIVHLGLVTLVPLIFDLFMLHIDYYLCQ